MHVRGKRLLAVTVGVPAMAVGWLLLTLPPNPRTVDVSSWVSSTTAPTVSGAFHVHTTRSDGLGSPDDVASAAQRAGLQFVVLTDHGDGTRRPDPPRYQSGVLLLDTVEVSTNGGHYIAIGLPPAPYPLGGEPDTVVEDVRRMGGFGVAAHPASSKSELAWRDPELLVDGIEWLNADSQWRDESRGALLAAGARYLLRPSTSLASLVDRPQDALEWWDQVNRERAVVGFAGSDAHGGVRAGTEAEGEFAWTFVLPDYEAIFRTFSLRAQLRRPWSGQAGEDAESLVEAFRSGRLFTVVDAVAAPVGFHFEAVTPRQTFTMGEWVPPAAAAELRVSAAAPEGSTIVLLADGRPISRIMGRELRHRVSTPGTYRVEVQVDGAPGDPPVPWLVSNAIYVGAPAGVPQETPPVATAFSPLVGGEERVDWVVEHDPDSSATVVAAGEPQVRFQYELSGSEAGSAYAAAVRRLTTGSLNGFDGLGFEVVADRPVRLFLQLRAGAFPGEPRWRKSFYADPTPRRVTIAFEELLAVAEGTQPSPDLTQSDAVLIVADRVNAHPGASATVTVREIRLERW